MTELFHRIIDLPFTTLILEVQERFRGYNLKEVVDHKVIEFSLYLSDNRSDGGRWIGSANDSVLAHSMEILNITTTRIS